MGVPALGGVVAGVVLAGTVLVVPGVVTAGPG